MWDWNRAILAPLATEAFNKSLRPRREVGAAAAGETLAPATADRWDTVATAGRRLLPAYYGWAAGVDDWATVQVETLFDVIVPQPGDPDSGLLSADGRGVLYRLRIDLVGVDDDGRYWIMEPRLRRDGFAPLDDLLLDDVALTRSWGWELGFLATVAGTIHNEIRLPRPDEPGPPDLAPAGDPEIIDLGSRQVQRDSGPWFRRTR